MVKKVKGSLGITIQAKDESSSEISRAQRGLEKFQSAAQNSAAALRKIATVGAGATAAVGGIGVALFKLAENASKAGDEVFVAADRIGVSAEFMSRMQFAAGQAGNTTEELRVALTALTRRASAMPKTFKQWGVSVLDANGNLKDTETLALDVADRMKSLTSAADRAAFAQDIMAEAGRKLVPVFKNGAAGLREMWTEADTLGATITTAGAFLANQFANQMDRTEKAISGAARSLGDKLVPYFTALSEETEKAVKQFATWIEKNNEFIKSGITSTLIWMAETGVPAIATAANLASQAFSGWSIIIDAGRWAFASMMAEMLDGVSTFMLRMAQAADAVGDNGLAGSFAAVGIQAIEAQKVWEQVAGDFRADAAATAKQIEAIEEAIGSLAARAQGGIRNAIERAGELLEQAKTATVEAEGSGPSGASQKLDLVKEKTKKIKKEAQKANSAMVFLGSTSGSALASIVTGAKKAEQALTEMALSIVQNFITSGILTLFTGGASAGGLVGGLLGFNRGGLVPGYAAGGMVPGSGNQDSVLARLTPGEFVLPKDLVQSIRRGEPPSKRGHFASGGLVSDEGVPGRVENHFHMSSVLPMDSNQTRRNVLALSEMTDDAGMRGQYRKQRFKGGRRT